MKQSNPLSLEEKNEGNIQQRMSLRLQETKGKSQKKTGSPVCQTIETIVVFFFVIVKIPN